MPSILIFPTLLDERNSTIGEQSELLRSERIRLDIFFATDELHEKTNSSFHTGENMRHHFLGKLVLAALFPVLAQAAPMTYNVDRQIGPGSVRGTITTDGSFGMLERDNIADWMLTINDGDGSGDLTLNGGINSGLLLQGSLLSADMDSIDFDFGGDFGFALFQNPVIGSGMNWWCVEAISGNCSGAGVGETVNRFGTPTYQRITTSMSIAAIPAGTNVPEPATMALFGLGLFALAASRRRQANSKNT